MITLYSDNGINEGLLVRESNNISINNLLRIAKNTEKRFVLLVNDNKNNDNIRYNLSNVGIEPKDNIRCYFKGVLSTIYIYCASDKLRYASDRLASLIE